MTVPHGMQAPVHMAHQVRLPTQGAHALNARLTNVLQIQIVL